MLLAIDVGNSRIKFGWFDAAPPATTGTTLPAAIALTALPAADPIDWQRIVADGADQRGRILAAVIAGPNPAGVEMIRSAWPADWPPPRVVSTAMDLPLRVHVEFPERVGIDRLLNAVAANVLRQTGRGAIIVSAGTATTIDLVTEDGTFAGGSILPGLELGARALHQHTALLPLVDFPALLMQERIGPLGRNTKDAIRSGLWYGQLGAIREIVTQLAGLVRETPVQIVTGGNGRRLAAELGHDFQFEADLALRGLAFVAQSELRETGGYCIVTR
jgi:type III pantothenate kinase